MKLNIFIDGSAKWNHIGAGMVVIQNQTVVKRHSYHKILDQRASSSIAEFWALKKALEWIDKNQPKEEISIFTDSQEVSRHTFYKAPPDVIQLLSKLSTMIIHIKEARKLQNPWILEAHNLSREYLMHHQTSSPISSSSTSSVISSPNHFISISLFQEGLKWIVRNQQNQILANGDQPIDLLYHTVKQILKESKPVVYFNVHATQAIRYFPIKNPADYNLIGKINFLRSLLR